MKKYYEELEKRVSINLLIVLGILLILFGIGVVNVGVLTGELSMDRTIVKRYEELHAIDHRTIKIQQETIELLKATQNEH